MLIRIRSPLGYYRCQIQDELPISQLQPLILARWPELDNEPAWRLNVWDPVLKKATAGHILATKSATQTAMDVGLREGDLLVLEVERLESPTINIPPRQEKQGLMGVCRVHISHDKIYAFIRNVLA
ncbi:uncharacterized protein I303_106931 [Kwoniella dejecticola CBS 10117]|uniref:Ubiquitin-like domain-containing protein n=1 Tax=Kwoniella dejecticola CBS 10117 TaxID=1296121 RepID=A0A1A5ZTA6_9TREE|nr:uncharacterized protein I303_08430 [Kwoniella dejecticola CBS 10117]OBR81048.1 hypothetical protein I303_08430 [Kwoniella dejecticola CBS 10117]